MTLPTQWPPNQTPQMSSNRDNHGWPTGANGDASQVDAWEDGKHWHGLDYNPKCEWKIFNDGTRFVNDPVIGTYSKSIFNGNHEAHIQDGYVHHVVGQRSHFTGDSHSEAVAGHHDKTIGGHVRNNAQDHYENLAGVHHQFAGTGKVSLNPGNQYHGYGGTVVHSALNDNASIGMGQGGGGQQHRNMMGMSKGNINVVASKDANVNIATAQGKMVNVQNEQGDIRINAQKGNITKTGNKVDINGKQQAQINGGGTDGSMQIPPFKVMGGATFSQGFKVTSKGATFMGGSTGGDTGTYSPSGGSGGGGSSGGSSATS